MITLIIAIALLGVLVYFVENYIPMPDPFKMVIRVIVVLGLLIYLVRFFGLDLPIRGVK
jgi:uncharacterized membrane protein